MQGDDNSLEEVDMFFSEWDGETTDNTGKNVKKLGSSVEFVVLVDKSVEAVGNGLSDHLSSGDELGVESVEDVFEIFSFPGLFGVEQFQELLDEGMGHKDLQGLDIHGIINDQLKEKFVDRLEMGPGRVNDDFIIFHARFSWSAAFFDNWERTEDVLLDHFDDVVKVRDDEVEHHGLVIEELGEFGEDV